MFQTIEREELCNFIEKKLLMEKIDFIACLTSPFHVLGVDAFLLDHSIKENEKLKGLVFIFPHSKSGFIVNRNNFNCGMYEKSELIFVENKRIYSKRRYIFSSIGKFLKIIKGYINVKLMNNTNDNNRSVFILSVEKLNFSMLIPFGNKKIAKKYLPEFVLIEEGMSNYMEKNILNAIRENQKINSNIINKKKFIFDDLFKFISKYLKLFLSKFIHSEKRCLFKKDKKKIYLNDNIIRSYKMAINYKEKINTNKDIIKLSKFINKKNFVLITTQPFVECNYIKMSDYKIILDNLIKIFDDANLMVIIKPHPREDLKKYQEISKNGKNHYVCRKDFLLEEILHLRPQNIYGFTSTSLITSKIFYEIEGVSLSNIIIKYSNNKFLRMVISEFKNKFSDFVYFVDEFSEILDILNKKVLIKK